MAVGDAENDHSLLAAVEFGVAVANAVESLKADADVVLEEADGDGIVALLDDVTGSDSLGGDSRRRITLGLDADDHAVRSRRARAT